MRTLRLAVAIAAAGLTMVGCVNAAPDTGSAVSAPPTAETKVVESSAQGRSPRGALPKELGEAAGLDNTDGSPLIEFIVHEITGTADCNPYAGDPVNGQFRTVRMTAATGSDPDGLLPFLQFGAGWEYVSATGRSVEASTSEAATCAYDVPSQLGPNRNYEFNVIVDLPQDAAGGVLVFKPPAFADGGWEWKPGDAGV